MGKAMGIKYGDKVEVLSGDHAGEAGWVTGLDETDPYAPTLGIERGDGTVFGVPWEGGEGVRKVDGPSTAELEAAYAEGEVAYGAGESLEDNPYPRRDARSDEWEDGWYDARKASTGRAF